MYKTVNALNSGNYFWRRLLSCWPVPFDLENSSSASLFSECGQYALIVTRREFDEDARVVVQVRDITKNEVLLEAILSPHMDFLRGDSFSMAVDEVNATNALVGFKTTLKGQWIRGLEQADI